MEGVKLAQRARGTTGWEPCQGVPSEARLLLEAWGQERGGETKEGMGHNGRAKLGRRWVLCWEWMNAQCQRRREEKEREKQRGRERAKEKGTLGKKRKKKKKKRKESSGP